MFLFGLVAQVLVYACIGALQPVMALHLKEYGLETVWIGLYFSCPAITYLIGALLLPCYQRFVGRRGLIFIAFILLNLSLFTIGTSPLLRMKDSPKCILVGLALCGFAASAITIPLLPEMLDQVIKKYPSLKNSDDLSDAAAGYFNGCLGIGEAIGPLVASQLVAAMGFRSACDVMALTVFVYTLFYFLFNGRSGIFEGDSKEEFEDLAMAECATDDGHFAGAGHLPR
mmetsp:Transcript_9786/g.12088  ORF Transcript_9786/g.12088 Transcript_9786/m.12088 type:complete len:228 (-) Transcript_9786:273-956(-)